MTLVRRFTSNLNFYTLKKNYQLALPYTQSRCGLSESGSSEEKSIVEELEEKIKILEDSLKQNAVRLNASENAVKTADSKLKQQDEQVCRPNVKFTVVCNILSVERITQKVFHEFLMTLVCSRC